MARGGITINYKYGANGVRAFQKGGPKQLGINKALALAVEDEIARLKIRTTKSHQDYRGGKFADYSPGYKKWKQENYGRSEPDLLLSGDLMASITREVTVSGNIVKCVVGFINKVTTYTGKRAYRGKTQQVSTVEKAQRNNYGIGVARREFFGFSDEQIERIKEKIRVALSLK